MRTPELSVVVVSYGTPRLLLRFLASLGRSPDRDLIHEVIIVDNGYPERGDSREVVDPHGHPFPIVFARNRERSYASGVNRGAALASGDVLAISNTDIELLPDVSLRPVLKAVWDAASRIGIAAPQLVYPNDSWQQTARRFPSIAEALLAVLMVDTIWHGLLTWTFHPGTRVDGTRYVAYVDAAFMVVDLNCFRALEGFDPSYSFYGEDADFCWRAAKAGWRTVLVPSARVMHVRGASLETDHLRQSTIRLLEAKQQFVRERRGPRRAAWYGRLYRLAVWERILFYGLLARLTGEERWRDWAHRARSRWQAVKRWPAEEMRGQDRA